MMTFFNNFLNSGHTFNDHELPLKFKFRLINTVMIIIVITAAAFGIMYHLGLSPIGLFHANANFLFAIVNLSLIFVLRYNKHLYDLVTSMMLFSGLATFTSALITIPNDEFRIMWFYITVLIAFFTGGLRLGYLVAAASIVIIIIANIRVDLHLSELAITTAVTGLIILTITVNAYTRKMLDLEESLISLNDSLHIKVQQAVEEIRRKDEAMLQQSRLAKMGEMIAMIAHQWRQPLSSISAISAKLQLSVALEEELPKETLVHELKTIDKRTTLLSNTIDDFRNFYNTNNDTNGFNLDKTISQVIEILSPAIKNADVSVHFNSSISQSIVSLESELIQVFMNIIKNAVDILKGRPESREIWIKAYQDNTRYIIVIEDNAGGIKDDILEQIFDPYFSTKKEKHGMGLGLYMSKLIIQEHCKGTLSVKNGKAGAIFTIDLPSSIINKEGTPSS